MAYVEAHLAVPDAPPTVRVTGEMAAETVATRVQGRTRRPSLYPHRAAGEVP